MNSTELSLRASQSLVKADLLVTENFNLLHHYKTRWRSTKLEQDDSAQKLSPIWFYLKICTAKEGLMFVKTIFTVYISAFLALCWIITEREISVQTSLSTCTLSQAPDRVAGRVTWPEGSQWILPQVEPSSSQAHRLIFTALHRP